MSGIWFVFSAQEAALATSAAAINTSLKGYICSNQTKKTSISVTRIFWKGAEGLRLRFMRLEPSWPCVYMCWVTVVTATADVPLAASPCGTDASA